MKIGIASERPSLLLHDLLSTSTTPLSRLARFAMPEIGAINGTYGDHFVPQA